MTFVWLNAEFPRFDSCIAREPEIVFKDKCHLDNVLDDWACEYIQKNLPYSSSFSSL